MERRDCLIWRLNIIYSTFLILCGVVFIIWCIPDNMLCKYILTYSTYLIICSNFSIILCTFIIIWGALNIIFVVLRCTYYHYDDDDDHFNIMPCTSSVLFGSLCNPWWRINNIICSTFFFMMIIFRKLIFGISLVTEMAAKDDQDDLKKSLVNSGLQSLYPRF